MIAVCAAKFVGYVCKKMGRQGCDLGRKVAIKICPDILEQLSHRYERLFLHHLKSNSSIILSIFFTLFFSFTLASL